MGRLFFYNFFEFFFIYFFQILDFYAKYFYNITCSKILTQGEYFYESYDWYGFARTSCSYYP